MDDVAKIQKINAMSQELKNFGFYENAEGAVEGATNVYLSEDEQKESKIFSTEDQLMEELANSFSRFKTRTDSQMQEMSSKIASLHDQIKGITESISAIETRKESPQRIPETLNQQASSEASQSPQETSEIRQEVSSSQEQQAPAESPKPQIQEEPKSPETQETIVSESQEGSDKPYYEKQGNFTPEDVKIENIFYYGNK